ncbi:hypothetical protein LZ30DRAFT_428628 [Colletotrichum cereale]|nr:hypothetical protein LZ30DRAFT_428628 [Colletotrichum cereale]
MGGWRLNPALTGLSMGERTGSRVLQWVWSYVLASSRKDAQVAEKFSPGLETLAHHCMITQAVSMRCKTTSTVLFVRIATGSGDAD